MNIQFVEFFINRWKRYFGDAELPIGYYYTNHVREEDRRASQHDQRCLICNLTQVREGGVFVYDANTPGCAGGKRYTGFSAAYNPTFNYFLSCGIPGKLEGERYKQTPELVKAYLENHPPFEAPGTYLVFKRWDKLTADEQPLAAIFFATPDVLSGLYTLANYDVAGPHGVIAPWGSGCASIVSHPYVESLSEQPRCVLGMFDVSARPCVPVNTLTFTAPVRRLEAMVRNMDESFLITESWHKVQNRL